MVIYLPGQALDETPLLDELTPREIVQELNSFRTSQVDGDRAFVPVAREIIRAGRPYKGRAPGPGFVARTGTFDFHDFGAQIAKNLTAKGTGQHARSI